MAAEMRGQSLGVGFMARSSIPRGYPTRAGNASERNDARRTATVREPDSDEAVSEEALKLAEEAAERLLILRQGGDVVRRRRILLLHLRGTAAHDIDLL